MPLRLLNVPQSSTMLALLKKMVPTYTKLAGNQLSTYGTFAVPSGADLLVHGIYDKQRRVEDVTRYKVRVYSSGLVTIQSLTGDIGTFCDCPVGSLGLPKIVLVIESPARTEYDNHFNPIAPAQGDTGDRIEEWFEELLTAHDALGLRPGEYELVICNPIQFQASMIWIHGESSRSNQAARRLLIKAWTAMYRDRGEGVQFLQRLEQYEPAAVMLACSTPMQSTVMRDVRALAKRKGWRDRVVKCSAHPSCWNEKLRIERVF
ncbi:hypothetical protein [Caldimonas tepidiphila]|uniref:hypothetical protein n=1 Tax=Caldimonas tepidiphila TaxID=2315841 RepID=UPI000E5BC91C|nr:hypothetical protein [Caldimonas tepidiphila]